MLAMERLPICTPRRTVWTFIFLTLVLACHARVPSSAVPQNDESFSVEGSDVLRLKSSSSSGDFVRQSSWNALKSYLVKEELTECEENYGIFPCSISLGGNVFLLLVYGFCLLKAAQFLSQGSELLLTVLNPGLIGGLLLPVLGATPDALLILVSGLSASEEDAQAQVLVGMGLLAGSTIMLLTLLWGSSLIAGRCDLELAYGDIKVARDKKLDNGWSLTETGVTTDQQTRVSSWIMMVTVFPYLVAQSPVMFQWSEKTSRITMLVGCILALIGLASYCTYQVAFPWIQQRWIYRARLKLHRSHYLHRLSSYAHKNTLGSLLDDSGNPNNMVLTSLFKQFDTNADNSLSVEEVRGLVVGLGIEAGLGIPNDDVVKDWMAALDLNNSGKMSEKEFVDGMEKWIKSLNLPQQNGGRRNNNRRIEPPSARETSGAPLPVPAQHHLFGDLREESEQSYNALVNDQVDVEDDSDEEEGNPPTKGQIIFRAVLYLVAGAAIAGVMADPLVGAIGNFSKKTGISPFFISFVATPMATNSSEAISSLLFALRKRKKNISMTYSQIYGGVTMNNTMCLAIFLAVVYYRGLTWDFSSEVLVILIATLVIGILASVRVTFPLWMALIALALYPLSIALVAVLDYVYGWQ